MEGELKEELQKSVINCQSDLDAKICAMAVWMCSAS